MRCGKLKREREREREREPSLGDRSLVGILGILGIVYEAFRFFLSGLLLCTILVEVCWVLMLHVYHLLAFCGFFIHRNNKA